MPTPHKVQANFSMEGGPHLYSGAQCDATSVKTVLESDCKIVVQTEKYAEASFSVEASRLEPRTMSASATVEPNPPVEFNAVSPDEKSFSTITY